MGGSSTFATRAKAALMSPDLRPEWVLGGVAVASVIAYVMAIVLLTGGGFAYSLDDPYIHLRVSELLWSGTYGVNPGEAAAPSSSILWPFLLAPFAMTPLHVWIPLLLGCGSLAATLIVTFRALGELAPQTRWSRFSLVLVVGVTLNWFGLPLTGMEHSLQVLVTVGAAWGVARLAIGKQVNWWFWLACFLGPIIRYENLSVTFMALVAAAVLGRWRLALLVGAASGVVVAAFSGFLVASGLPPLPSSVVVKWSADNVVLDWQGGGPSADAQGTVVQALWNAWKQVWTLFPNGLVTGGLVLLVILAAGGAYRRRSLRGPLLPFLTALGAMTLHIGFGRDGWFGRYEIYALSFAVVTIVLFAMPTLTQLFDRAGTVVTVAAFAIGMGWIFHHLLSPTIRTPEAGAAVYRQQVQMHRIAVDFLKAPVAVNDLGAVSYQNPYGVVDLAGLGSYAALQAARSGDPNWIESFVDPDQVPAAMIYTYWFGDAIPDSWRLVGSIETPNAPSLGGELVDVYATSPANVQRVAEGLSDLAQDLPRGTRVIIEPGTSPS